MKVVFALLSAAGLVAAGLGASLGPAYVTAFRKNGRDLVESFVPDTIREDAAKAERQEMEKLAAELRALRSETRQNLTKEAIATPKVLAQSVAVEVKSIPAVSSAPIATREPDGMIAHFHLRCGCPANIERRNGQLVLVERHKDGKIKQTQLEIVPSVPVNWISLNPISSGHLLARDPRMDLYRLATMTTSPSR